MTVQQEKRLITKLLDERDLSEVTRIGLTANSFLSPEAREVYVYMMHHFEEHGEIPSRSLIRDRFPEFKLLKSDQVQDSLSALCAVVREAELQNRVVGLYSHIKQSMVDPRLALEELQRKTTMLVSEFRPVSGTDAGADAEAVYTRYQETKKAEGVIGIPWPWPYLNETTRGMRRGQYIALFAKGKTYKTWIMCHLGVESHKAKHRVLFIEQEMPTEEIHDRVGALYGRVPWGSFYVGKLLQEEDEALVRGLDQLYQSPRGSFQIERLSAMGAACVTELEGLIDRYEPNMVLFDGVYLPAGRDWQQVAAINSALKALALRRNILIVGSAQENKEGTITYQTFEQDCDMVLRISKDPERARANEVLIEVPYARQVAVNPFTIHTIPARSFDQKAVMTEFGELPGEELQDDDEPEMREEEES